MVEQVLTVFRQSASTDDFLTKSFELAGATCGENVHEASPPSTGLTDVHFTLRYQVFASSMGYLCSREKQMRPLLTCLPSSAQQNRIRWLLAERAMHADPPSPRPTKRPVRTFPTLPSNLIITRFLVPSTVPCGLLHSSTYSGGIAGRAGKASAKSTTEATQEGKTLPAKADQSRNCCDQQKYSKSNVYTHGTQSKKHIDKSQGCLRMETPNS